MARNGNGNDPSRRLEFLEQVYIEDRKRWREHEEARAEDRKRWQSLEEARAEDRKRWQSLEETRAEDRKRWQQNDDRWRRLEAYIRRNESLHLKHDRHVNKILARLERHDEKIDAMQKAIHRILEGRSSKGGGSKSVESSVPPFP